MARRSNNSNNRQRDSSNQSLDSLLSFRLRPPPVLLPIPVTSPAVVAGLEDRRLFHPGASTARPKAIRRDASRVVAAGKRLHSLRFADPALVSICAKRQRRKQVLFALNRTRKGSAAPRRKNFWSRISCHG